VWRAIQLTEPAVGRPEHSRAWWQPGDPNTTESTNVTLPIFCAAYAGVQTFATHSSTTDIPDRWVSFYIYCTNICLKICRVFVPGTTIVVQEGTSTTNTNCTCKPGWLPRDPIKSTVHSTRVTVCAIEVSSHINYVTKDGFDIFYKMTPQTTCFCMFAMVAYSSIRISALEWIESEKVDQVDPRLIYANEF